MNGMRLMLPVSLFWLIVTPGLWIGSGGTLGWICHIIAAMTAYHRATVKNRLVHV